MVWAQSLEVLRPSARAAQKEGLVVESGYPEASGPSLFPSPPVLACAISSMISLHAMVQGGYSAINDDNVQKIVAEAAERALVVYPPGVDMID